MAAGSTAVHDAPTRRSRPVPIVARLLPKALDNRYRGHPAALWILGLLLFFKGLINLGSLVDPARGYVADGIPLGAYPPSAAQAVVGVGAFLDAEGRAMVPLMYLVLVIEFLAHKGVGMWRPIVRTAEYSGSFVTLGMFALTLAGLVLAMTGKDYSARRAATQLEPAESQGG
jgi:hypothetical protein